MSYRSWFYNTNVIHQNAHLIVNFLFSPVKDLALRQLQEDPSKFLPTLFQGQSYGVSWIFQDILYTNFNVTDSAVEINSPLNFDLWLSELSASVDGRFTSGSRTTNIDSIKLTDLHLNLKLNSGLDRNEKPVVYIDDCSFTFGDLVLGYAGGSYQMYHALTTTYHSHVKNVLTDEVCYALTTLVEQINGRFQWVDNGIIYDYSLTALLYGTNQYIESQHRGEHRMTTGQSSPYTPVHMPDFQENDAMFYVMVNEYVVKTAMFVLDQSNRLYVQLEPQQLSETCTNLLLSVIDRDVSVINTSKYIPVLTFIRTT
ncbi:uncharacterized protein LOC131935426 [Physella acuta]|uniref:uncharacterized protein LOC131935426 n=1 Tax=Physella acuta TaxID=109671 RepID=UPI0027DAD231|nr:uncharacterized protein LOC131935426 [Physella acuta]